MIRPLRRRHRLGVPIIAVAVAVLAVVALARRPGPPPALDRLPTAPAPRFARIPLPALETTAPVAVYWSEHGDAAVVADGARLLGVRRAGDDDGYPVPTELAARGALTLWDLERQRVVGVVPLDPESAAWR